MRTRKKKKKGNFLFCMLVALCLCVLLVSGLKLYQTWQEYREGDNLYTSLAQQAITVTPSSADTVKKCPKVVDFDRLRSVNQDTVAWIYCADTPVDFPVARGVDNVFYLRHLLDGTWNNLGTIFMDFNNAADFSDDNSVLYGHHMNMEDTMFSSLENYKQQEYYDAHPVMVLSTPEGDYEVELFSGTLIDGYTSIPLKFGEEGGSFEEYVSRLISDSTFTSDVTVEKGDRLLTMVTCSYDYTNARYMLVGKLVPYNT